MSGVALAGSTSPHVTGNAYLSTFGLAPGPSSCPVGARRTVHRMAYLKPPLFIRSVVNKLAMAFGVGGSVTLAVTGRRTGQERAIPLVPVEHEDVTYLVSARGDTDWVQNLRAARRCELRQRGRSPERYTAEEVPVEEREPIIEQYRAKTGKSVQPLWRKLPDPADHPTFRLTPA